MRCAFLLLREKSTKNATYKTLGRNIQINFFDVFFEQYVEIEGNTTLWL